jgi:hypothetical protein
MTLDDFADAFGATTSELLGFNSVELNGALRDSGIDTTVLKHRLSRLVAEYHAAVAQAQQKKMQQQAAAQAAAQQKMQRQAAAQEKKRAAAAAVSAAAAWPRFVLYDSDHHPQLMGAYLDGGNGSAGPWRQENGSGVAWVCPKGYVRVYASDADWDSGRGMGRFCSKKRGSAALAGVLCPHWPEQDGSMHVPGWMRRTGLIWVSVDAGNMRRPGVLVCAPTIKWATHHSRVWPLKVHDGTCACSRVPPSHTLAAHGQTAFDWIYRTYCG